MYWQIGDYMPVGSGTALWRRDGIPCCGSIWGQRRVRWVASRSSGSATGCHAHIGYIPHEHIIGISKLTRLVRLFARRFTVQERIGQQIADTLEAMLQPHGVAVYLEAHHLCTQMRGVPEVAPLTRTTFWRGEYDSNAALRAEFFDMCGVRQ